MSYYEESLKPRSEKITLVTIESVQRLKLFTADGDDWTRLVDYFVVSVKDDGVLINEWEFTPTTKTLKLLGGDDPKERNISVTYRHFFSSAPVNLPYDLINGEVVEWEGRVSTIGSIGQQLDNENTGTVLESSSSVDLINSDGYFAPIFDTHIWENQNIKFYSWFPSIPIEEKIQLFEGLIESKVYADTKISFKVKDFVFKLKNQVNLGYFTEDDGVILPSLLNTPKRRIYGQVDNIQAVSLDAILDGYLITGTIAGTLDGTTLTGTATLFLDEVSPGDELFVVVNEITYKIGVESVDSNTQITTSEELEVSFADKAVSNKPALPWRKKNRFWHVAGHKLRAPSVEILIPQSSNTFLVDSTDDFFAGDEILINGFQSNVRRISGNKIITTTNIVPTPAAGDMINKRPIKKVFIGTNALVYERDYLESNVTESIITFEEMAEFNLAAQRRTGVDLVFTNGSRILTTADTVDLRTIVESRDWIRSANVARDEWYEILSVDQQTITLRTAVIVSGGPYTEEAYYKNLEVIDESSLITVNCLGMEVDNVWMKTPSDAVRHLVLNDAGFSVVNEAKFAKAKVDCGYIVSMAIPKSLGQKAPLIRDVITDINNSVFGSLYGDSSQNISYSILNSTKPELINIVRDDDILSYTVETTQKIANKVILSYRPYVDIFSGEDTFRSCTYSSKFVDDFIGIQNTIERTIYIYAEEDAITMAQRIALFNSLSATSIKLKAKMNFAQYTVNDKIYLDLENLFARYGGLDQRKIGMISGVKRDGYGSELTVTDLGNIYNRIPSIAPDETPEYSSSSADDKIRWGYILDNDTLTPDPNSEEGLGNFIIG